MPTHGARTRRAREHAPRVLGERADHDGDVDGRSMAEEVAGAELAPRAPRLLRANNRSIRAWANDGALLRSYPSSEIVIAIERAKRQIARRFIRHQKAAAAATGTVSAS